MVWRFKAPSLFLALLMSLPLPARAAQEEAPADLQASQRERDRVAFAEQMRVLSVSLEHLPNPPKLDQTLQIPVFDLLDPRAAQNKRARSERKK